MQTIRQILDQKKKDAENKQFASTIAEQVGTVAQAPTNVDLTPLVYGLEAVRSEIEQIQLGTEPVDLTPIGDALLDLNNRIEKLADKKVPVPKVDLSKLTDKLDSVNESLEKLLKKDTNVEVTQETVDLDKVTRGLKSVKDAINGLSFPAPIHTPAYKNTQQEAVSAILTADGRVPVDIGGAAEITLEAGDIQIGAVEIKDGSTDQRQTVHTSGAASVKELRSSTGTVTSVSDTASSTTLLASNTSRLGGSIYNDSTAILYVKLGATASTTSFTTKVYPEELYEIPGNYTGIIDGIWASDASGAARITELT